MLRWLREASVVLQTSVGKSYPLGATLLPDGVNFSIYSKHAHSLDLLLYDHVDQDRPVRSIALDAERHRTGQYWHVFVGGLARGQVYAWRAHGPFAPQLGHRFDGHKVLLDPYGSCVLMPEHYDRSRAGVAGSNDGYAAKNAVVDLSSYDWQGDQPPKVPFSRTVIYELHLAGFTAHPSSGVRPEQRGTYLGLIEKIPYLRALGITAVELLPVFQFDAADAPPGKRNYWGYSPMGFFSPHRAYASNPDRLMGPLDEFRDMVKALHRAGIEVLLDVVFNHTAEGDERGPCLSLRGLENTTYYILEQDRSRYANFSGTGNTLNTSHSVVRRLIYDALRFWVEHMHVDGFRFDLASILARDAQGRPLDNPPALWSIESDPVLAHTKLIAEPWDAGGLYQLGHFPGDRWKEWNARFRDDVRAFVRGDRATTGHLAARLLASPDVFEHEQREAEQSINFVTCHDGFTLNDVVSYNEKHNLANGENNQDGSNYNLSWNCGVEGPSTDLSIEVLRNRQVKNFLGLTLLSLGVPMILMGDEVRRTQQGNNNAYAQDNEVSWFDWSLLEEHADVLRFTRKLIEWRHHIMAHWRSGETPLSQLLGRATLEWHGVTLHEPDFGPDSHSIALTVREPEGCMHLIVNAFWRPLSFQVPPCGTGLNWRVLVDTGSASPTDAYSLKEAPALLEDSYQATDRSLVMLIAVSGY